MGCFDVVRILFLVFVVVPVLLTALVGMGVVGIFIFVALLGLPLMFLLAL
jgi:hypothetical protein